MEAIKHRRHASVIGAHAGARVGEDRRMMLAKYLGALGGSVEPVFKEYAY